MKENFSLINDNMQNALTIKQLKECNVITEKYGLILVDSQIAELAEGRNKALKDTERIEFGEGILKKLILAFCDSRYLMQENYSQTIYELQEAFYFFKNESNDTISDDEIIEHMRTYFDGLAQGSIEYIIGTSLEELCGYSRGVNNNLGKEDSDDSSYRNDDHDEY